MHWSGTVLAPFSDYVPSPRLDPHQVYVSFLGTLPLTQNPHTFSSNVVHKLLSERSCCLRMLLATPLLTETGPWRFHLPRSLVVTVSRHTMNGGEKEAANSNQFISTCIDFLGRAAENCAPRLLCFCTGRCISRLWRCLTSRTPNSQNRAGPLRLFF